MSNDSQHTPGEEMAHDCMKEGELKALVGSIEILTGQQREVLGQLAQVTEALRQNAVNQAEIKALGEKIDTLRGDIKEEQRAQWRRIDELRDKVDEHNKCQGPATASEALRIAGEAVSLVAELRQDLGRERGAKEAAEQARVAAEEVAKAVNDLKLRPGKLAIAGWIALGSLCGTIAATVLGTLIIKFMIP